MRTAEITKTRRNGASHGAAKTKSANGTPDLMKAKLLKLLRQMWVTPLIALDRADCMSLSQRCGEFRRAGIKVLDKWVDLANGKRVKAYRVVG